MPTFTFSTASRAVSVSAGLAMVVVGTIAAMAPAAAAPASDSQGYVDSTARCTAPAVAVLFGSTSSSRVAICKDSDGTYEYRGVRVRDGAKLVLPAKATDAGFVAESDGVSYTVTGNGLKVATGGTVIRNEPMSDVHEPQGALASTAPTTGGTSSPSTSATSSTSSTSSTPTTTTPTTTTPLPPPLPAEVGGSR